MSLCQLHWFSRTLQKQVATTVILPDNFKPPYPTFYLLHGLSDDNSIWLRRTRIEYYARNLPLIIVMPDGYRSFYTNHRNGPAYADYIACELPTVIERTFPARSSRRARSIGGLSMGGYGAFRIALGHARRFISASSHSGCLAMANFPNEHLPETEFSQIFGRSPRSTDHDLVHLARRVRRTGPIPHLSFDCGTEDFLLGHNRFFHKQLNKMGYAHEYVEYPGDHNWDYWDTHVQHALAFHCHQMGID